MERKSKLPSESVQLHTFVTAHALGHQTVFICGCGGGYDIFGGLPLYFDMCKTAKKIVLVNFSFTDEQSLEVSCERKCAEKLTPFCYRVDGYVDDDAISKTFFPEARLASLLKHSVYAITVHANPTLAKLTECYQSIIQHEQLTTSSIDAIYLVDGGCDVLLTGTERGGLGTPVEDMMHLKVLHDLLPDVKEKYVLALGVDLDLAHGVDKTDLDQRLQDLDKHKVLQHRLSLSDPCVAEYSRAVKACQPINSIVQSMVLASLEGHTGCYVPHHLLPRIQENRIFLSDRVHTVFLYPLDVIAQQVVYLNKITSEMDTEQVDELISDVHDRLKHKG